MKPLWYVAFLSTLSLLLPLSLWARDKNQHSVNIPDAVEIGGAQLQPGNYIVEWQQSGAAIRVEFKEDGKIVATASGTLKTNDPQAIEDSVVTQTTNSHKERLKEIDFGHQKEALIFG